MSKARTVWTTAFSTGSSLRPRSRSAKKRSPKVASASALTAVAAGPTASAGGSSTMSSAYRQKPYSAWTWWRLTLGRTSVDQ